MCPRDVENGDASRDIGADLAISIADSPPAPELLFFDHDENLIFDREALGLWLLRSGEAKWQPQA
jgi:hypothetical protein